MGDERPGRSGLTLRGTAGPSTLGEVLRHRSLRLVGLSWGSSTTAEGAYLVVLGVFAYEEGGAVAVGLVGLIRMVPASAAASFGSLLADRFARERILRAVEAMRAALLAGAAFAAFAGAPAALVFMVAAVHALVSGVFRPSFKSLLPSLARTPAQLVAANAAASTLEGFGTLVGPALGGVLIATAGASVGFAAASACCLVSFGLLMALRVEGGALRAAAPGRSLGDVLAGFRTVASSNNPRLIVALFAAQTFVRGALSVLIVVVALDLLALGQSWVGFLMAAIGAGGVVGALAATGLAGRPMAVPLLFGLVLWGAPIATIGAFPSAAVALLACMTIGAGNAIIDVAGNTLLQRVVPNEVLGRVFGAFVGLTLVAVGLGSIVTPAVIDALGTRGALVVTGALLPLVALIAGARVRAIDRDAAPPERELGFVRGVPMLAALSVACAEQIASRLSLVPIAAGRAIISEGER